MAPRFPFPVERIRDGLADFWDGFVGPEATRRNSVLTAAVTVAGTAAAAVIAARRGGSRGQVLTASALALDISGGVYVNNTLACARWYEREGQGGVDHLAFAALHVHPFVVARLAARPPAAAIVAARRGGSRGQVVTASALALDISGGIYVNNTLACARWYEREGHGDVDHLAFAALHVHPFVVARIDARHAAAEASRTSVDLRAPHAARSRSRGVPRGVWAGAHYAYMLGSTALIRARWADRRVLGPALALGGVALDEALGRSALAPWFAPAFYSKLLLGHASAALFSDAELTAPPELG